jgi:phage terminase Nu1 subunit (DNA packaging protein)
MDISLTKKELATVAGYTYRRLHEIDLGLPADKKLFVDSGNGKYDLPTFVQRWVKFNIDRENEDDNKLAEAKTRHEIVKTKKTELEVARLEGKMIDVQDVRKLWSDIAITVVQNALALPQKLAPILVMQENEEVIAGIIDDEIRVMLEGIADTPLPSYVYDEGNQNAEDDRGEE